jgi:hypothetical protein
MKKQLSQEDINAIIDIVEKGRVTKKNGSKKYDSVDMRTAFLSLLEYFKRKEAFNKVFKLKYFQSADNPHFNSYRPFIDHPVKIGVTRTGIKYGIEKGYIIQVSERIRKFDLIKLRKEGLI